MITKNLLYSFIAAVFVFSIPVSAQTQDGRAPSKVKADISRFGTGDKAKVVVTMKDGRKVKGSIVRSGDDSFDVADPRTKRTTAIAYQDVSRVKKPGMSKWVWVAIGAGAGVAVTVMVVAAAVKNSFPDIRIGLPPQ